MFLKLIFLSFLQPSHLWDTLQLQKIELGLSIPWLSDAFIGKADWSVPEPQVQFLAVIKSWLLCSFEQADDGRCFAVCKNV